MMELNTLTFEGYDPIADKLITGSVSYPVYACGHCSAQVVMNPRRQRPRKTCLSCGRWICEQNELCQIQCTPLYAMAKDHFEGAGRHGRLVPAIMKGITKVDEAEGLVTGD